MKSVDCFVREVVLKLGVRLCEACAKQLSDWKIIYSRRARFGRTHFDVHMDTKVTKVCDFFLKCNLLFSTSVNEQREEELTQTTITQDREKTDGFSHAAIFIEM